MNGISPGDGSNKCFDPLTIASVPAMRRLSTYGATEISLPSMLFEINAGSLFFFFFFFCLPTKSSGCVSLSLEIKHRSCGLCLNPWLTSASGCVSQATTVPYQFRRDYFRSQIVALAESPHQPSDPSCCHILCQSRPYWPELDYSTMLTSLVAIAALHILQLSHLCHML